jgi:prepilin-type N-terminal cleavage/methylation domain-containing protein
MRIRRPEARSAFTLVEVMIAVAILAILTMTVISSMTFSSRATRINSNRLAAKNITQGFLERMMIDDFANVGPPPDGFHQPPNGGYADIPEDADPPVWLDEALGIPCRITFEFKGFGQATGGSSNTLVDAKANWNANEWRGDTLYIVLGRGAGQYARIIGNTADTMMLQASTGGALIPGPDSSSIYMVNGGKTVEITTSWQYLGGQYEQTMEGLIVNYRGHDVLGFAGR